MNLCGFKLHFFDDKPRGESLHKHIFSYLLPDLISNFKILSPFGSRKHFVYNLHLMIEFQPDSYLLF